MNHKIASNWPTSAVSPFALIVIACLMLLTGCAIHPQLSSDSIRSNSLSKVAIIQNNKPPKASFETFAKGRWAGSGKGLLTGLGAIVIGPVLGASASTIAGPVGIMIGAAAGSAGGALYFLASPVVGAVKAIPADEAKQIDQTIPRLMIDLKVQENFANHINGIAQILPADYEFQLFQSSDLTADTSANYQPLRQQGFDAFLEMSIDEIGFIGGEGSKPTIALFLKGHYRLFDFNTNSEIFAEELIYKSAEHTLEEWTANNAEAIIIEFDNDYFKLASQAFGSSFTLFDSASGSWNTSSYCLLKPENPPFEIGMFSNAQNILETDSLKPTLQWQAFPRKTDRGDFIAKINKVTYDLKIWETSNNSRGKLIYQKNNLPAPLHTLEKSLQSNSDYFWTVRAEFEVENHRRVTQWAFSRKPLAIDCSTQQIPENQYFKFATPGSHKSINPRNWRPVKE